MSIPILEACKKRKRRPKLFGFHTFGDPGSPIHLTGPFRENIQVFLRECAETEDYNLEGMPICCTLLVHESRSLIVPLYTIEEDVKTSPKPYCDHCRSTGWSNHFVTKRKYHFLIPVDDLWNKPLDDGVLDAHESHLLYGLIHSNGHGHLLCINGLEGGSKYLFGREIMDLWDRICTILQARKITVADASKKRSMDLRLLHGVAYGHPWFGRWGYGFCHGSFGVRNYNYDRAIEILCSLELETIINDFNDTDQFQEIKQIIRLYRDLSETQLITLKDLLRFMLTVKSRAPAAQRKPILAGSSTPAYSSFSVAKPFTRTALQSIKPQGKDTKPVKYKKFGTVVANMDSRWPPRRLEFAADVIVNALKEKKESHFGNGGMTRQDVRDAARLHIGDTGLLDYVLKSLNNVVVGNQIVRRAVNPSTRILEYTIHEVGDLATKVSESERETLVNPISKPIISTPSPTLVPGIDVYNDVVYLYKHVLLDYPASELVELATQTILDTKHFVKEWPFRDDEDQILTFMCRFMPLSLGDGDAGGIGDIVSVPLHATVGELKRAVESALRDTYCVTEQIVVTEIEGLEDVDDGEVLFGRVESGVEIRVRGSSSLGVESKGSEVVLRRQGGSDTWMVRCDCGARDDDGERMVACDICEVWQHTRCCGIDDAETVPPLFVCSACCVSLVPPRAADHNEAAAFGAMEYCDDLLLMNPPPVDHYGLAIGY
ncbi:Autoimmune regulator [Parasponia andersonii]|uniref:Autoimmune regulator n=1 Tax=Parasponia andersonii TaxID=3476 RepID=A0A2P5B3L7_PARAD|nr:Autoimmune regulator [Parasponia andersonii]